jgi:hypothetical protein
MKFIVPTDVQDNCRVYAENNWKSLGELSNSFILINRQTKTLMG